VVLDEDTTILLKDASIGGGGGNTLRANYVAEFGYICAQI
jgi:hypothetical protein